MKRIHTTTVTTFLSTGKIIRLIQATAPLINTSEAALTKAQRHTLVYSRVKYMSANLSVYVTMCMVIHTHFNNTLSMSYRVIGIL